MTSKLFEVEEIKFNGLPKNITLTNPEHVNALIQWQKLFCQPLFPTEDAHIEEIKKWSFEVEWEVDNDTFDDYSDALYEAGKYEKGETIVHVYSNSTLLHTFYLWELVDINQYNKKLVHQELDANEFEYNNMRYFFECKGLEVVLKREKADLSYLR